MEPSPPSALVPSIAANPLPPAWLDALGAVEPVWLAVGALGFAVLLIALGYALGWASARSGIARARESFAALAAEALRDNTEGFLALAGERFARLEESSESDWETRRKALDETVGPLREALDRYRSETLQTQSERGKEVGILQNQIVALTSQTTRLAEALRSTGQRGRWGELTLKRTAELAGLTDHCDFGEQVTVGRPGHAQRPDMVVRLPGGREVVVDAKAPLDAYLEAIDATDDDTRRAALENHARQVRRHVDTLAGRGYTASLERTPDFVVLFLPDESFLGAAALHDRTLVEHALAKGVVLATPATLYALLGAIARGWREVRIEESSRQVLALARELDERLGLFVEHLAKLGGALGRSVDFFNKAVGSLEARVLPQSRRMRELGIEGRRDLSAPEMVSVAVRPTTSTQEP